MNEDPDLAARLRRHFDRETATLHTEADVDDLADRLRHRHLRRQRALASAIVVVALAGPLGGFALGRAGSGEAATVHAALPGTVDESGQTPAPELPNLRVSDQGTVSKDVIASSMDASLAANGSTARVEEPLGRRFVRTTDDGVVVRVYDLTVGYVDYGNPMWTPPPWCFPSGFVQADVSTDAVVGIAFGSTYSAVRDGDLPAELSVLGVAEGSPVWAVVAQAPEGAQRLQAVFPGGAVDEMEPVDGVAVLAATTDQGEGTVQVSALDANGAVVAERDVAMPGLLEKAPGLPSDPSFDPACQVPAPALPPPGEQPPDPDAARAAVISAYTDAYTGRNSDAVRASAMEDPTGFEQIFEQLRTGSVAQSVLASTPMVKDLVFTAPDHAWVQYDILIEGGSVFGNRFGEAALVDGVWKVANSTMCRDITLAGMSCPGDEPS